MPALLFTLLVSVEFTCLAQTDTTPPRLVSLSISPTLVDVSTGPAILNIRISASDDLSGFGSGSTGNGSIDIRHSSGSNPIGRGSLPITGGTNLNPVFEFILTVPQFSPLGSYPISLTLIDNVFNTLSLTPADLQARGLPSAITVSTGQSGQSVVSAATIPHLASGDGWQTTIRASGSCSGGCVLVVSTYDINGILLNSTTQDLPASSNGWARSLPVVPTSSRLTTGWIEVKAVSKQAIALCASALFTNANTRQEASSSSNCTQLSGWESGAFGSMQYFYTHSAGYTSGIALLNKASSTLVALLQWRDESDVIVASRTISLLPKQQVSFTSTEAVGKFGRLTVTPDPAMTQSLKDLFNKSVHSLGFQFSPFGSFTQLPIIN